MPRSKTEIYLHLVWATRGREPLLTDDLERDVYRCIEGAARQMGCLVLAVGGLSDHIHLVVQTPAILGAAELAKRVKGTSSNFANEHESSVNVFSWQEGYAAFSISQSHVARVVNYVQNQKLCHAAGTIWDKWEEIE